MCNVRSKLTLLRHTIIQEVYDALKETESETSYTTIWREYEAAAIKEIIRVLIANIPTFTKDNFEMGDEGSEKNRLADLAVVCAEGKTVISIKTAKNTKTGGPRNDLGTFKQYPSKKKAFNAVFELWIRYTILDKKIRIQKVYFDEAYRFVGYHKSAKGVGYRKKDGNMRPKSWKMFDDDSSYWKTPEEFEKGFQSAKTYRANSLVEEHYPDMKEEDQRKLYEKLKAKFELKS
jgi:hypothetical protein